MGFIEEHITPVEFRDRHCCGDGNFYKGYVIGLGYVYPKAGMMYPSHWCGYGSGSTRISGDDTHCVGGWQYEVDDSMESVIKSMTPIRDVFREALVQDDGDGSVKVVMGFNKFVSYAKGSGTCDIDFVESSVNANQVALQISVEFKSDTGDVYKEVHQIASKDLVVAFGLSAAKKSADQSTTWQDTLEFWAGVGGIACSAGQVLGKAMYSTNLATQFRSNFELMNHNNTKAMVDNAGKIWKGANNSPLVNKTLGNNISNVSRYFPLVAPYLRTGGRVCGFIGIALSVYRLRDEYRNDNGLGIVDAGADVIMGVVGMIPVHGWIISGGYFIAKPLAKKHTEVVVKSQIEMGIAGYPSTMPFK